MLTDIPQCGAQAGHVGAMTAAEVKQVKTMPAEEVISRWKGVVRELGNILVQYDCAEGNSPRQQELMDSLCRTLDRAVGVAAVHSFIQSIYSITRKRISSWLQQFSEQKYNAARRASCACTQRCCTRPTCRS